MVARDLWQRKPHLALGLRPCAWWVYCHTSLEPYMYYNIYVPYEIFEGLISNPTQK